MKKIIWMFIFMLIFLINPVLVNASQNEYTYNLPDNYQNELSINSDVNDFMNDNNISLDNHESISSFTPQKILEYIWNTIKSVINAPIKLLSSLIAVIIINSLVSTLSDSIKNENTNKIYNIVSVLVCVGVIINPVIEAINKTSSTLINGSNFMISYIPIFSSIVVSSGNITAASSYNCIVLAVSQIFVQIAKVYLLPVLGFCMALSVVESINPTISLSGIVNGLKKICTWGIGLLMTIFVGMLTIQSIVGTSADTVAIRAGKFMVSSLVPVVGKSISDAYTTLKGSLGLLRSGVGSYGIIALVVTVLPTIIYLGGIQLCIGISQIISDIFGIKQINDLLKNTSSVLSIAMSLLLLFTTMLIISTTIIMMIGMNIG